MTDLADFPPRFWIDPGSTAHLVCGESQPAVVFLGGDHPLVRDLVSGSYAYFVHSYAIYPDDRSIVLATTDYGGPFASIVGRGKVCGLQFHPEKSQAVGLKLLRNFLSL